MHLRAATITAEEKPQFHKKKHISEVVDVIMGTDGNANRNIEKIDGILTGGIV